MLSLMIFGLILLTSSQSAIAADKSASSLCRPNEQVFFSCRLQGDRKIVSLCGSTDLTAQKGYLKYRFGALDKLELEFPADAANTQKQFRYAHYARYRVERTAVAFDNKNYRYTVFDNYEGDSQPESREQGVAIERPRGKQTTRVLACAGIAHGDLQRLGEIIPCDPNDPLNMGECP